MTSALPQRVHLVDLELANGATYFWSSFEGSFPRQVDAAAQLYKPWLTEPYPTWKFNRSIASDGGQFTIQNLSGNSIDREVAALLAAGEFEGARMVYRPWLIPDDVAEFEAHGYLEDPVVLPDRVEFTAVQRFNPADFSAYEYIQTRDCHFRYRSAACGMRRGTIFQQLTTANIFSAASIGNSGLAMTPDLYRDEVVMIIAGTGAGQERYILTHTATAITPKSNFAPAPDGTSQFLVTGAGTMKVGATLADIFSSTTIGKTGLGRGVNADQNELVMIISGTGAGQERKIISNTSTTYTVSPAWTTVPDGTSRFVVIYRICAKDRASCSARGMIERFPGLIHLQAQLSIAANLTALLEIPETEFAR